MFETLACLFRRQHRIADACSPGWFGSQYNCYRHSVLRVPDGGKSFVKEGREDLIGQSPKVEFVGSGLGLVGFVSAMYVARAYMEPLFCLDER